MSFLLMLAATSLLLVALFVTPARDAQQANAENYIKQSESEWAAAASKGDTSAVKRILADDFRHRTGRQLLRQSQRDR